MVLLQNVKIPNSLVLLAKDLKPVTRVSDCTKQKKCKMIILLTKDTKIIVRVSDCTKQKEILYMQL